ncbi:MAG: V-type ATP synthase subunit A, partial [Oscillospiraceae bacterium]
QFYERAGVVECLGADERQGSLTAIGAVSPPGGDTSEPVSQATMRIVKVFWGLDSGLAYSRHFPAINWLTSYSLYVDGLKTWYDKELGVEFMQNREKTMGILQEEASLQEIVKLVGQDALSFGDRLTLETAKMIREDFLQQNAFVDVDSYSSYERQAMLLAIILEYDKLCRAAMDAGADMKKLITIPVREQIGRAKNVPADEFKAVYTKMYENMKLQINEITTGGDEL